MRLSATTLNQKGMTMHYHLEIIMPPTDDVEAVIEQIMAPFDENCGDNSEGETGSNYPFWDYWVIGGRWSGSKLSAILGYDRITAFQNSLIDAEITVSSVVFGKETLHPPEQAETVDRMWNKAFPESFVKVCPLFDNYKGDHGDVMRLSDVPRSLKCAHLIVAGPDYKGKGIEAKFMVTDDIWNGVNYVQTTWNETLGGGLDMALEKLKNYNREYAATQTPAGDWLVVTVDYHS